MIVSDILKLLNEKNIELSVKNGELAVLGQKEVFNSDPSLLVLLRANKKDLIEFIKNGEYAGSEDNIIDVPPNDIPPECKVITPVMLPLAQLTVEEIDYIVGSVPGGAANVQDIYPLAPLQEGILFHHMMAKEGDPYLLYATLGFDTRARLDGYLQALQAVIDRHDILRTAVLWQGLSEPVQVVWRHATLAVEEVGFDPADGDIAEQLHNRFNPRHTRLDVRQAPLMRGLTAHDAENGRWLMLLLFHHMAIDHTAMDVIQQEMKLHLRGQIDRLPRPLPFRNFVAQARLGISKQEHETFFTEMLGGVDEPTAPFGLIDVQGDGSGIAEATQPVERQLARSLRACARKLGVSAASICHLAWAQVLARVSGRNDVVFGTLLFGRMQGGAGADRTLGLFINTLPIRIQVGDGTVQDSVLRTHKLLAQLLRHEHAPLTLAQRCSGVAAPTPLFSALLNYRHIQEATQETSEAGRNAGGVTILAGEERTNYPLALSVNDLGEGFSLTVQVEDSIDPMRVCAFMHAALAQLVYALEHAPVVALRSLDVLPATERQQLLVDWNSTQADYPQDHCIHHLFEAAVEKTPDAIAAVHEDKQLTYAELNGRANRLAHHLQGLGVAPDARVAICVERSLEMVVGLLAILKAGGAYVPLDPAYPLERLAYMLEDSAPVVLVVHAQTDASVQARLRAALPASVNVAVVDLSADADRWARRAPSNLGRAKIELTPDHLAYVIYTSGSTGQPKGVMVEHRGVVNRLLWMQDAYRLDSQDAVLQKTPFSFDVSVWEFFWPLLAGAKLVMARVDGHKNPAYLADVIREQRISTLHFVPSMLQAFLEHGEAAMCSSLIRVMCSGEALPGSAARRFRERLPHVALHNLYGPTETSVDVTAWTCAGDVLPDNIPIGRPIANTQIYLLDAHGQPAPVGVAGELHIGGVQVARGYLNRAELTAERFIGDPFSDKQGARLYKTGDLARWLPDGNIEFLGRNDFQVKIRGFRIELGEIEARLTRHPAIREAVVLAREDHPGDKRLVAYYTANPEVEEVEGEALRTHVLETLPEHMAPTAYVALDTLPLTANGKLDRKALPAPGQDAYAARGYEAPVGEIETTLAGIWADVLKRERVGRHDNFFELGGHSLLAINLIERMFQAGLLADVRTLFATPTLAALAAAVDGDSGLIKAPPNGIPAGCEVITPAMLPLVQLTVEEIGRIVGSVHGGAGNVQDIYPLAPLQEGILFHHMMAQEGDPYLLCGMFGLDTHDRLNGYVGALQAVIDRHDILRTAVLWEDLSEPVQVVWRHAALAIDEIDLDPADGDIAEQLHNRFDPRHSRLDVRQAPLMRVFVARDTANERWIMLLLFHHLVSDHTSLNVIRQEMELLVQGQAERLPTPLPFRNFVAQARLGVTQQEHETFFTQMLGDIDEPTTPFGLINVQGDGSGIAESMLPVEMQLARRLRARARRLGVSAASLCHLAWAQVLARISNHDDVVFGTLLFGRMQGGAGADRALGLFINTLPMRIRVGDETAQDSVLRTHKALAQLLRHEHASLALAQRCSGVAALTPLFSALLNYRHGVGANQEASGEVGNESGITVLSGEDRTNYPLTLSVDDLGEGFRLTAQVQKSIDPARVCAFMHNALEQLVGALEQAPATPLRSLDVLPVAERRQLLVEWNATQVEYPQDRCIHQLFEEQVEKTPEAVAVVHEDRRLTYAELNARANQLAHYLQGFGVVPDARVAICVERGLEMMVGLLAILKTGGAYVPLDPAYPVERLAYMLEDSAPIVLLTQSSLQDDLPALSLLRIIVLDDDAYGGRAAIARQSARNPEPNLLGLTSRHLAYVIYTSGSTGLPKGVMVEHRNLVNLIGWHCDAFELTSGSYSSSVAGVGFDAAAWEVWPPLCVGAALLLPSAQFARDPQALLAWWKEQDLEISFLPTPLAEFSFASGIANQQLRTLLVGGDRLRYLPPQPHHFSLINNYGPTEATVVATSGCINVTDTVLHIGRPISNTQIYLLDAHGRPTPIGVVGEMHIGGAGVARGYLNHLELTTERFIADSFSARMNARMYKTGDLARWLPNGNIEFIGRSDFQVKIRGFRIELGEIEAHLARHPAIRDAVVLAREDQPGDKQLVAYYTTKAEAGEIGAGALRTHLLETLPDYMAPAAYVMMETLPLTPNGKIDRKALPVPNQDAYAARGYEAPIGEVEVVLAGIWADVLRLERIGRHDNFFELGGHSLLAVGVVTRLHQVLQVEVSLTELFAHPQLSTLAQAIGNAGRSELAPIPLVSRDEAPPLSFAQQRLWFLAQMDGVSQAYRMPTALRLTGKLDRAALRRALDRIVARHEALRTTFVMCDGEPAQHIAPADSGFALQEIDLRGHADAENALRQLVAEEATAAFSLDTGPLIRGRLVWMHDTDHALLVTMHHIVSDGWSIGVLINEMSTLYGAFIRGGDDPLPPLAIQYADYAAWQRRWLTGAVLQAQAGYWQRTLAGAPALLELPTDRPRPAVQDHAGAMLEIELDPDLTAGLKAFSQRHGVTLFMTLLTAWGIVLARLSGQQDIVIGSPVANRTRAEVEPLIGFFVNTLALRLDLSGNPAAAEALQRVKGRALDAQQHQDLPFEQVVEIMRPARSLARSPLFQVMFAWQNNDMGTLDMPGLTLTPVGRSYDIATFDLALDLAEAGGRIVGGLEYATALFDPATIERHGGYLRNVLAALVADDSQTIEQLPLLDASERQLLLVGWNATQADYPQDCCIHQLFEAQAEKTPNAIAVAHEDKQLTYAELNVRANRLAHHLHTLGVEPDARVGLCVERSLDMVVGLLAILKAGGAYVPLDPAYPPERLAHMLQDSAPMAVLTHGHAPASIQARLLAVTAGCGIDCPIVDLASDAAQWAGQAADNPACARLGLRPGNLAYIIYTSGSTGAPKGVMIEHRSVCNYIAALQKKCGLRADDRILQFASINFDASVEEIFAALLSGATSVLRTDAWLVDGSKFWALCEQARITVVDLPTRFWHRITEDRSAPIPERVRIAVIGGEAFDADAMQEWLSREGHAPRLFNAYGPTETTISATLNEPTGNDRIRQSIGRPLANTRLYILDSNRQPAPIGVAGEIYIGGVQVARGYLNHPELTAERFVADPFGGQSDARMYKTGDIGRRLSDGSIEYLKRSDFQVKIRGFRIELGEIEVCLARHPAIREAVVLAREDNPGDKLLVAYYTANPATKEVGAEALRAHLLETLPDYMTPTAYVMLDTLPLTPNGKLDRKALPAPRQETYAARGYEAPIGVVETALAGIWADVLKLDRIDRHDNFFELGGHSLLAVGVLSRLRQILQVEIALTELFAHPQLSALAQAIGNAGRSELPPIPIVSRADAPPLSFAQQRLWFLSQMDGVSQAYHMPAALRLAGRLDYAALRRALGRVVARHEALRTTFVLQDGEPVQHIAPADSGFALREIDLRGHADVENELRRLASEEAGAAFYLDTGPLIRGRLVRMRDTEHALLVTMHHIVSDGWSIAVLVREMSTLYSTFSQGQADPLPPLAIQYADYAVWQRSWLEGDVLQAQTGYWQRALTGAPTLLDLPIDRPRPAVQDHAGAALGIELDHELTATLKAFSQHHGATLFMTLLTAWGIVLARLSGQQDIVIGTPVANRPRAEVEPLIGFFVNTLALRLDLSGNPTAAEALQRVKGMALDAQQHQDLPFEQVVEIMRPARSMAHSPLFQVMFAWQNNEIGTLEMPGLTLTPVEASYDIAKFDLTLNLAEIDGRISGSLEYATALFEPATITRHCGYLRNVLAALVVEDRQAIERLPLLDSSERQQLLAGWNATQADYPPDQCIHTLFEAQVEKTPNAVAVAHEDKQLTYAELNVRANRLAHYLQGFGVVPDARVAICVERGLDMVVGLLAIVKAGGAYVPLDPAHPIERLVYMLEDSAPVVLITHAQVETSVRAQLHAVLPASGTVVNLDTDAKRWARRASTNPDRLKVALTPKHLAYVIYTSGSTGRPKGVMVEHKSVVNLIEDWRNRFEGVGMSKPVASLWSSMGFDVSVFELFIPLSLAGTVHITPGAIRADPKLLLGWLQDRSITFSYLPPFFVRSLQDETDRLISALSLKQALVGVESLNESELSRLEELIPDLRIVNGYGPTEATIYCTTYVEVSDAHRVAPIGRPIANTQIYLLDAHGEPTPIGATGEIYIGGAGVARGYLNRPELTAERFVADPFSSRTGARLYKTGDLGRYLPSANIEFLGRNDFQVKIRGFRVELGEIEVRLERHPAICEAVVLAREDSAGEKRLVAYYTANPEAEEIGVEALRAHLLETLPDYMAPAAYVALDALPLTTNGKLDRMALPAPGQEAYVARGYEAPAGEIEIALADMWAKVLKLERIGRRDNFFELGGHSLLLIKVADLLRQTGIDVTVVDLFKHPTVRSLAIYLARAKQGESVNGVLPVRITGTQPPLFLLHEGHGLVLYSPVLAFRIDPDIPVYGLPGVPLDEPQLQTMEKIATRLIRLIYQVQPSGPYRVAGWSYGGMVAYEIAVQLIKQGQTVEFVGLLDSYAPGLLRIMNAKQSRRDSPQAYLLVACEANVGNGGDRCAAFDELRQAAFGMDFEELFHRCSGLGVLPYYFEDYSATEARQFMLRMIAHDHASEQYVPLPIGVPIDIFIAQDQPDISGSDGSPPASLLGWGAVLPEPLIRVHAVPGNHQSMMGAHIDVLGQALTNAIVNSRKSEAIKDAT